MLVQLNDDNFNMEISEGLKLVDFYTTWCHFCQKQDIILKELSDNGMWIGKIDCDKNPKTVQEFKITGFPSFVLFKNGKKQAYLVGYHSKGQLLNELTKYL